MGLNFSKDGFGGAAGTSGGLTHISAVAKCDGAISFRPHVRSMTTVPVRVHVGFGPEMLQRLFLLCDKNLKPKMEMNLAGTFRLNPLQQVQNQLKR